jgi:hypothetical protein
MSPAFYFIFYPKTMTKRKPEYQICYIKIETFDFF